MYSYNKMKRKFSEISNQENEYKTKTLAISITSSLPCEICNKLCMTIET